jgi:hypothetical protein
LPLFAIAVAIPLAAEYGVQAPVII